MAGSVVAEVMVAPKLSEIAGALDSGSLGTYPIRRRLARTDIA
jgi:hypothetical protein